MKIGQKKHIISTLSLVLMDAPDSGACGKRLIFGSFGNRDLLPFIYKHLREEARKCDPHNQNLDPKLLKEQLLDKYYKVLTKLKLNKSAL